MYVYIRSTIVNHWIFFVNTVHRLFKLLLKVKGLLSLAPMSSFSSLIGYCACLLRVWTAQIVACLAWHLFPLIAATNNWWTVFRKCLRSWLGLCTHLAIFSFCSGGFIQVHRRALAFCFPEFHVAEASTFWKRQKWDVTLHILMQIMGIVILESLDILLWFLYN